MKIRYILVRPLLLIIILLLLLLLIVLRHRLLQNDVIPTFSIVRQMAVMKLSKSGLILAVVFVRWRHYFTQTANSQEQEQDYLFDTKKVYVVYTVIQSI